MTWVFAFPPSVLCQENSEHISFPSGAIMGKGGHAAPPEALNFADKRGRQPTSEIPFTIGTLRRAIPPHCFERSVVTSSAYLAVDLVAAALLYWGSTFIDSFPLAARFLLWPAYWFCQVRNLPQPEDQRARGACMHRSLCRAPMPAPGRVYSIGLLALFDLLYMRVHRQVSEVRIASCAGCCVHRHMGYCP